MNIGAGIKYDPKTNKVSTLKPIVNKGNLEKMPKVTLSKEQQKKIIEDARKQMGQKKQQTKKKPSVGATLKYALKKTFSKKKK